MHTNDHKCGHSTSYIWWLWWRGISPWLRIRAGGATSISMTPVDVIRPKQDVLGKSAGLAAKSCSGVSEHPQELDHPSCFYFLSVFFIAGFPIFLAQCLIYIGEMRISLGLCPCYFPWFNAVLPAAMFWCPPCVFMRLSSSRWRGAAPFHGGRRQHP